VIHGLRVFGGNGDVARVCQQQSVEEIVISSMKMSDDRVEELVRSCADRQITVRRMRITIEELN
jgi:FlaA1/EpsC-like NDP-sugar epimerase